MIAIKFTFPTGRYHATPWGRHVNEADVEWPPSPWRLMRTLIATWHRKGNGTRFRDSTLEKLIEALAESPPCYSLPPVRHAHTRHYMPVAGGKKTLVFDAFVQMNKEAGLIVLWPDLMLMDDEVCLLDDLLSKIGYLGRSESWVIAERIAGWKGTVNCLDAGTDIEIPLEEEMESVSLIVPLTKKEYSLQREALLNSDSVKSLKGKKKSLLTDTLPIKLVEAIGLDTGDYHATGWNMPPASRELRFIRPYQALNGSSPRRILMESDPLPTIARVQLVGKPLPKMENALKIGETFRRALISTLDKRMNREVPPLVSGHGLPKENRHGHAYFLPEDANGDGRIDHLLLHIPEGIPRLVLIALERMGELWVDGGTKWRVITVSSGNKAGNLCAKSRVWQSVTPYLHPWFKKKKFGLEEQVQRECRLRSLPMPKIEILETIQTGYGKRPVRPLQFHRFRNRRGLVQPDTRGNFLRLVFEEPMEGPLALGFGCHFGLGLFHPKDGGET